MQALVAIIGENNASQALFALYSLIGFNCVFDMKDSTYDRLNLSIFALRAVSSSGVFLANARLADFLVKILVANERIVPDTRGLAVK